MTAAGTERPIDIAGQFLADLQVFLGYEYAEPGRLLFPQFAPYFSRLRDLPLAEHLEQAYLAIVDRKQKQLILEMVTEALVRCARTPLGINRSLVVVDLVHAIAPHVWTNDLWLKLLWRPVEPKGLAQWVGALALRWAQWNISVELTKPDVLRAIECVEPARFRNLLEYMIATCTSPSGERSGVRNAILDAAHARIARDAAQFAIGEVDCAEIRDFLYECEVAPVVPGGADFVPIELNESSEALLLRRELDSKWNLEPPEESPWPADSAALEDEALLAS